MSGRDCGVVGIRYALVEGRVEHCGVERLAPLRRKLFFASWTSLAGVYNSCYHGGSLGIAVTFPVVWLLRRFLWDE